VRRIPRAPYRARASLARSLRSLRSLARSLAAHCPPSRACQPCMKMAGEYAPAQYAKTGGLHEFDLRSLAQSHDKSAIPNRDPTHPSGGKRKRVEEEARALAGGWSRTAPTLTAPRSGGCPQRHGGGGGGGGRGGRGAAAGREASGVRQRLGQGVEPPLESRLPPPLLAGGQTAG